jgi:hypothetical protein
VLDLGAEEVRGTMWQDHLVNPSRPVVDEMVVFRPQVKSFATLTFGAISQISLIFLSHPITFSKQSSSSPPKRMLPSVSANSQKIYNTIDSIGSMKYCALFARHRKIGYETLVQI